MAGAVMTELLEVRSADAVRYVESHTPPDWFERRSEAVVDSVASEERIEQLRALGYLGD
jgi:hypothetical protein